MNIVKQTNESARHPGDDADLGRPITTSAQDLSHGPHRFAWHSHTRAQLVYAAVGVIRVETISGLWWVPPQQAVWVPARIEHEVAAEQAVSMRSLYVHERAARRLPTVCGVVPVKPLLRELIVEACRRLGTDDVEDTDARLTEVILDELQQLRPEPLYLPIPQDKRLRRIVDVLAADPTDSRTLDDWGRSAGASARTLARRFQRETGLSFGRWRQRLRILSAIPKLAAGDSVTRVAYDLGYRSPSAFIAVFRRTLGQPPARFARARREQ